MTQAPSKQTKWSCEDKETLRSMYGKATAEQIGLLVSNRNRRAVIIMARRMGLNQTADQTRNKRRYKKWSCNESFFSVIRPVASYWAGILAADGWVKDSKSLVALSLNDKDADHVESFKAAVAYDGPVSRYAYRGRDKGKGVECRVLLCAVPKMVEDLKLNYGVVQSKTRTLMPPAKLDDSNAVAFIAGYVDGDGSVSGDRLQVAGTESVMKWIHEAFNRLFPNRELVRSAKPFENARGADCWHYSVSGARVRMFQDYALSLGLPVMQRKWPIRGTKPSPVLESEK